MASSSRACSDSALSVPAGPCGIANSARHEQQVSGSARRHGYGPLSSPVPTLPKNALFAGVSGTRSSVPSSDPAFSGLVFPMVTAPGQPRPWCSRQAGPSTRSRKSSSGPRPRPPCRTRPRRPCGSSPSLRSPARTGPRPPDPCRSSAATPAAPAAPRPPSRPEQAPHTTGQGKKKTREAPAKKWDVDNHTSSGSLTHLAGNLSNTPLTSGHYTAQPTSEAALIRFALKPLALPLDHPVVCTQEVLLELGTARTSNTLTVPAQEHFLRQARPTALRRRSKDRASTY